MRKSCILLSMAMTLLLFWGCDNDPGTETDFEIDYTNDDGTVIECSATTYKASFSGTVPAGGRYFWLGMADRHGDSLYLPAGPYQDQQLEIKISHYDNIPDGLYFLKMYGSNAAADVGDFTKAPVSLDVGPVFLSQAAKVADSCYAFAEYVKQSSSGMDIVAARCSIDIRYGAKLAGDPPDDTSAAHGVIHVVVNRDTNYIDAYGQSQTNAWGHMGYGTKRFSFGAAGDTTSFKAKIVEAQGYYYYRWVDIYGVPPLQWTVHEFEVELDSVSGRWFFYYDGSLHDSSRTDDPLWQATLAKEARWGGEVLQPDSDMPGTDIDRCKLIKCEYAKSNGAYMSANFTSNTPDWTGSNKTNFNEWMIQIVDSVTLEVWDVNPRP